MQQQQRRSASTRPGCTESTAYAVPPEHLLSPLIGKTGFIYTPDLGYPKVPPLEWDDQHTRCEEQTLGDDSDLMPTCDLYAPLLERVHPYSAFAQGYTTDY